MTQLHTMLGNRHAPTSKYKHGYLEYWETVQVQVAQKQLKYK